MNEATIIGVDVSKAHLDVFVEGDPKIQRCKNTACGVELLLKRLREVLEPLVVVEATGRLQTALGPGMLTGRRACLRGESGPGATFCQGQGSLGKDRSD